jgi:hypothetical protein
MFQRRTKEYSKEEPKNIPEKNQRRIQENIPEKNQRRIQENIPKKNPKEYSKVESKE